MDSIFPDNDRREEIEQQAISGCSLCWTCSTCDLECPVFLSTNRLRPQVIVRMANLGLLDELLDTTHIWYCIGCRRCEMGCPNRVKPFELVRYLRKEMIRSKRIGSEITVAHFRLMVQFQRVRYRAIRRAMHYQEAEISQREWYQWMGIPIRQTVFKEIEISGRKNTEKTLFPRKHTSNACLFCSECSNCCPISFERSTYDPQVIIRKFNLGMFEELLQSPMIWMCLECRTCSQICSQLVRGHELIRALRQLAIQSGRVDSDLPGRLFEVDRNIYPRLLDEIDQLCGMFGLKPDHS